MRIVYFFDIVPVILLLFFQTAKVSSKEPERIVIEGESFLKEKNDFFTVKNYGETYFCGFGSNFMSRQKCLAASEKGEGQSLCRAVNIKEQGTYRVWARYEHPAGYNTCFGIELIQNDKIVFSETYGNVTQVKLFPYGNISDPLAKFAPEKDWSWGGGDNVVWQGYSYVATLVAGACTVRLTLVENPEPAAQRNIDVIMLTTDTSPASQNPWLPFLDDLAPPETCFLRITNPGDSGEILKAGAKIELHRNPFVHKAGSVTPAAGLAPRTKSEWLDISKYLDTTDETTLILHPEAPDQMLGKMEVEIRGKSRGMSKIWKKKFEQPEKNRTILIPCDFPQNMEIKTGEEVTAGLLKAVSNEIKKTKKPEKILFYANVWDGSLLASRSQEDYELMMKVYEKLGINTLTNLLLEKDFNAAGRVLNEPLKVILTHDRWLSGDRLAAWKKAGIMDRVLAISLGDELEPCEISEISKNAPLVEKFRLFLKEQGYENENKFPVEKSNAVDDPGLYYFSCKFREKLFFEDLNERRLKIQGIFPEMVYTGVNFSPHPVFRIDPEKWISPFRHGALTMGWTEDYLYQVPEVSPQLAAYLVDVLKCGFSNEPKPPIMFYVMPHTPGNTTRDVRLITYQVLAHGARYINYFCLFPKHFWFENFVAAENKDRYLEIQKIINEIGKIEDYLCEGNINKKGVAVLISESTSIWEGLSPEDKGNVLNSNVYDHERKCLWLSLMHKGIPVDFITEEDVLMGRLSGYRVFYLTGDHIKREACIKIKEWVRDEGILFANCGAAHYDEFNNYNRELFDLFGIDKSGMEISHMQIRTKCDLPKLSPLDKIRFNDKISAVTGAILEAPVAREEFSPASEKCVIGVFDNGKPAALMNEYGNGKAIIVGTLPATEYVRKAIPKRPWDRGNSDKSFNHFLPVGFDENAGKIIYYPLELAGIEPDVEIINEPLIEKTYIVSQKHAAVILIDFSGRESRKVNIRINTPQKPSKVWSLENGELEYANKDQNIFIQMQIHLTDVVVIEW